MEKFVLPVQIESSKLTLRRHELSLAYTMFEAVDNDRQRLREFLPWVDAIKSVDSEIWYINECLKDWDQKSMFDYGIFTKNGDYAGNIGVHTIQWDAECCELGYWILGRFEGQGIISAAVRMLEDQLFEDGFHRIEIRCDPSNKKSAAVPLRNGYNFEGVLRQNIKSKDIFRDTAVYGKLKTDLRRANQGQ